MRILILVPGLLALCVCGAPPDQKKPQKKAPDIEVLETKARRADGKIEVDGRVRATGEKTLRGLVVVFDLVSPENEVVASEKAVLEEDAVEPGQELSYHAETSEAVRAVKYRIRAFDGKQSELRAANTGPFPIE